MNVLYAGLVCWLVTTILVESELARPLRDTVQARRSVPERKVATFDPDDAGRYWVSLPAESHPVWDKLAYLVSCHLCSGTWVGLALGAIVAGPLPGGFLLNGLLYKAVGHLALCVHKALEKLAS